MVFLLALLAISAVLAACGKPSDEQEQNQKLSIMLDWYPNAVHSFLYAAEEQGYFAEEGLDVTIQMPAETNDALKLVAAGQIDLALSYQPQVLMARGEEIPVKSIAAIVRHPLTHLMTPDNGEIASPKDLAGHRVGFSSIPLYEAITQTMIAYDGGDFSSVSMIDVGWNLVPAIATGQTDAIMGGFINHEKLLLAKEGHPVVSFDPTQYGVPDYYELVLVASEKGLDKNSAAFARFVKAIIAGQSYVEQNPEKALDTLLAHENETAPLEPEIEKQSLDILLPLMNAGSESFGYQDAGAWEAAASWLKEKELLPAAIKAGDAYENLKLPR